MRLEGKCRVCGTGLNLAVDDQYAEMGDPMKLTALATCNRCYDYKCQRDRLDSAIIKLGYLLITARQGLKSRLSGVEAGVRENLMDLTKQYAQMITKHYRYPSVMWSEEFVNILMEKPEMAWRALGNYRIEARRHFRGIQQAALGARPDFDTPPGMEAARNV